MGVRIIYIYILLEFFLHESDFDETLHNPHGNP